MTEDDRDSKKHQQIPVTAIAYPMQYDDDEISLIDLWLILARRKWVFWATFVLIIVITILYLLIRSPTYAYNSALRVGQMMDEHGQIVSIEAPASVLANLQNAVIPDQLQKFVQNNPGKASEIKQDSVTTRQQGDTDVLTLHSKGSISDAGLLKTLQKKILSSAMAEQAQRIQSLKQYLQKRQQGLEQTLKTLSDQRDQTYKHLSQLADSGQNSSSKGAADALITMQSIGSLQSQLISLNQEIQNASRELTTINARLISFQPTQVTLQPSRSLRKSGPGNMLVLVISIILAFLMGLIATAVIEFFSLAKSRQQSLS